MAGYLVISNGEIIYNPGEVKIYDVSFTALGQFPGDTRDVIEPVTPRDIKEAKDMLYDMIESGHYQHVPVLLRWVQLNEPNAVEEAEPEPEPEPESTPQTLGGLLSTPPEQPEGRRRSNLDAATVKAIMRDLIQSGGTNLQGIAEDYGISLSTVSNIKNGKAYADVKRPNNWPFARP